MRPASLLFLRDLFPRGGLGEDPLGVVFEQVAAAGAADPVGLALMADLDRAAALGNDAQRVRIVPGEGDRLSRVADLAESREGLITRRRGIMLAGRSSAKIQTDGR